MVEVRCGNCIHFWESRNKCTSSLSPSSRKEVKEDDVCDYFEDHSGEITSQGFHDQQEEVEG